MGREVGREGEVSIFSSCNCLNLKKKVAAKSAQIIVNFTVEFAYSAL